MFFFGRFGSKHITVTQCRRCDHYGIPARVSMALLYLWWSKQASNEGVKSMTPKPSSESIWGVHKISQSPSARLNRRFSMVRFNRVFGVLCLPPLHKGCCGAPHATRERRGDLWASRVIHTTEAPPLLLNIGDGLRGWRRRDAPPALALHYAPSLLVCPPRVAARMSSMRRRRPVCSRLSLALPTLSPPIKTPPNTATSSDIPHLVDPALLFFENTP
jgi:hypothetical protein